MTIHDLDDPGPGNLIGLEIRANEPGGRHWEGRMTRQGPEFRPDDNGDIPPGTYELSFREPGTTAWANDARLPTVEV